MRQLQILLAISLLLGCNTTRKSHQAFLLQGAWTLQHVTYPDGSEYDYTMEGNGTLCLLYDRDSTLYECRISAAPSGLIVLPTAKSSITLVNKGGGDLLYLEDDDPHPLHVISDSVITIQRKGVLFSWIRADDIYREWGTEIRDIIVNETEKENAEGTSRYALSVKERQQASYINWLATAIGLIAIIAIAIYITARRRRRQLLVQLQQIQEVREFRPQAVKQAVATVESEFFTSDEYAALQKRINEGQRLKEQDWEDVERHLKTIYPGFISQLRGLHPMSDLEYQTCLLIKLHIAPKDIANVLARDVSTISTVRSRLYKKVFNRKGGAKEWDDLILSIGT